MLDLTVLDVICEGAADLDEQETTINIDYQTKKASIYSSRPQIVGMLKDWLKTGHDQVECLHIDQYGIEVQVPLEWVKFRMPKRRSEEWKSAAQDRLQNARALRWKDDAT
jgi:hypothetical protein